MSKNWRFNNVVLEEQVPVGQVPESKEAEVPTQDEFGQLDANASSYPQDQQQLQENMSNARGQAGRSIDPSTGVPGNPVPDSYAANQNDQRRNAGYNADGNASDGRDRREGGSNRGRPAGDDGYGRHHPQPTTGHICRCWQRHKRRWR